MIQTFQRTARPAHEASVPLDGRDTQSAIVRNGRWVMIRDLHLIRDFTAAELEVVRLEKSRAANPEEVRSIELVLSRHSTCS
jgi:hypothetical protein